MNQMDLDYIEKTLAEYEPARRRGDADLNPGMKPMRDPLTPASVLVPLVIREEGLNLMLTLRTAHLNDHAGQVSFPGGRVEDDDRDVVDTALRETEEEVGLDRQNIRTLGQLDPYITRTGFHVTPIVGIVQPPFDLQPDSFEVEEVFEVPFSFFMDRGNHEKREYNFESKKRFFYAMPYDNYYIWGATAGMIVNLVDILEGQ